MVSPKILQYDAACNDEWCEKLNHWEANFMVAGYHHLGIARPEPLFALNSDAHHLAKRLLCWQEEEPNDNEDDTNSQKWAGDIAWKLCSRYRPRNSTNPSYKLETCNQWKRCRSMRTMT